MKITVPPERPGKRFLMTTPAHASTGGTKTVSPAFATVTNTYASRLRSGTGEIPILKERLFGLTGNEGNHGEDVKEYYFYLDSTPPIRT